MSYDVEGGYRHPTMFGGQGALPELFVRPDPMLPHCAPIAQFCIATQLESTAAGYHNIKLASVTDGSCLQKRRMNFSEMYRRSVGDALGKFLRG